MSTSSIVEKSIGFLLDEFFTASLKYKNSVGDFEKTVARLGQLKQIIFDILSKYTDPEQGKVFADLASQLFNTVSDCWDAQEIVMLYPLEGHEKEIAVAAKEAQRLNAVRNNLIKQIDQLLGYEETTVLGKSYG